MVREAVKRSTASVITGEEKLGKKRKSYQHHGAEKKWGGVNRPRRKRRNSGNREFGI